MKNILLYSAAVTAFLAVSPAFAAGNSSTNNTQAGVSSNWEAQNNYWRNNYSNRPYYSNSNNYSTYEPAYRYGVDAYNRSQGRSYDDLDQNQLESGWNQARGSSNLSWSDAQMATRDAYNRLYQNQGAVATGGVSGTVGTSSGVSGTVGVGSGVSGTVGGINTNVGVGAGTSGSGSAGTSGNR